MADQAGEAAAVEAEVSVPMTPVGPPADLMRKIASGGGWLWAIAALSAVSFVAEIYGWGFRMLVGMGAPLVASVLAGGDGVGSALLFGLVSAVLIIGFVALAWLANAGRRWAYMVAGVVYLVDALLLAMLQDWPSVVFHGIALMFVFQAWHALGKTGPVAVSPAVMSAKMGGADVRIADIPTGSRLLKIVGIGVGAFVLIMALMGASIWLFTGE